MLRQARYLVAVIDHGSFTKASQTLRISQPALSQQVRQLEDSLGVELLDRSGGKLKVTDAGRAYLSHARRAIQSLDAARRAVHDVENLSEGILRLAFLPLHTSYLVGPAVHQFHRRHPGIALAVDIMTQAAMEEAILADRYDIGLGFGDLVTAEEIEIEPLHEETLCLIVGEANAAFRKRALAVQRLNEIEFAFLNPAFVTRAPIDYYLKTNGVRPRIALESNSIDSILSIVKGSRLATILPETVARGVSELSAVRLDPPMPRMKTAALEKKTGYQSAAAKAFLELMREWSWPQQADRVSPRHIRKRGA